MTLGGSIRARLLVGAALVLVAFMAGVGVAVERAHADSVRSAHFGRLQATVYLILAAAEVDPGGALVMPMAFAEPRLSLPGSGLYAGVYNERTREQWQSPSAVGMKPPFRTDVPRGAWRYETVGEGSDAFLAASFGVRWAGRGSEAAGVVSALQDKREFDREIAVFSRSLWTWLVGAGVLLLLAQLLLLRWGLAPLRRVARELRRIEAGEQERVAGAYPSEIAALTDNLNTLLQQERVRQSRYREALSFLAHSLKTPLAVLRSALADPAQLPQAVQQQVARMDDIVQHQLGRAAAGGATRFARPVAIAPVLERTRDALAKVYAGRQLAITIACPPELAWRIDEGDLFEMMGNLMDNAAKWARSRVAVAAARERGALVLHVDDDGPGFAETEAILQLHVRGDERVPGHGVGLAVVNDLVASHHGELRLERSPLGGARVAITLPPP